MPALGSITNTVTVPWELVCGHAAGTTAASSKATTPRTQLQRIGRILLSDINPSLAMNQSVKIGDANVRHPKN
jgi:hypothetical protein